MSDLDAIRDAVLEEARRPPRSPSWTSHVGWLLGLSTLAVGVSLGVAEGLDLGPIHTRWSNVLFGVTVVWAAVACVRPGSRRGLGIAAVLAALSVAAHLEGAVARGAGHSWIAEPGCALAEVGVSIVPLMATLWVLTRFAYRRAVALVAGIGAASSGMLVLDLTCHVPGAFHAVVFHVLPMIGLAALLVWARARARTHAHVP